jgi:hypothetical protein
MAERVVREYRAHQVLEGFLGSYEWVLPDTEELYDDFVDLWKECKLRAPSLP